MSQLSLYELTEQRLALQNKLLSLDFDSETIADTLEGESTELQAKIEDYGFVIRNMEAFSDAIKAEEKRFADRRKAHEAKVEKIKAWLLHNMQACGISKIDCPAFSISVKTNPPKVIIDDEAVIPERFMVVPELPQPSPDKKAIASALKCGELVEGCHIEQAQRIEIK
jgi:hypothetical protein